MTREKRKERVTRQREEQILNAALEVFSSKGFGAATIPDIAGAAGLSVGSIYNYFPNKRELFISVIRYFILNAPLLRLLDELPKGDVTGTLKQIMRNRLVLLEGENVSRIPFLMAEVQRDPELKTIWYEELLNPFMEKMENIYRRLSESGNTNTIEPVMVVRMTGGMILGFLMLRIMEGDNSPVTRLSVDEVTDSLVNFISFGLYGKGNSENNRGELA